MYNIVPYFLLFTIILILYKLLNYKYNFVNTIQKSKYSQLDGLRGVLAISVIFHHSIIMYNYFLTGIWAIPPSSFYTLIGQVSVALFFIITGFLFGFKLLNTKFETKKFFISRIRRIIPLHIFSVILSFFIILTIDNFILKVDILDLFISFFKWLNYGFYYLPLVNDNPYSSVIETVYWTLKKEWGFYIALPIFFLIRTKLIKNDLYFILIALVICTISKGMSFLFTIGILLSYMQINTIKINSKISDALAIISLIIIFMFFDTAYTKLVYFLLFFIFLSVIYGSIFKKLLEIQILQYFGKISYSIYLLHNIIIFVVFYMVHMFVKDINELSTNEYWLMVFGILVSTILISSQTYKYIEDKFYHRVK